MEPDSLGSSFPALPPIRLPGQDTRGVADDWPISYDELEPYYDENDRMMGVSGFKGDPAYPGETRKALPPFVYQKKGEVVSQGIR
ncbi:MAG: hypothetical protein CM1200mP27_11690 [Chloroflexota bacterium]|nr:MAG: hypothetical protein CM1200mP27_11690 [Chloroflexota bacterium]